MNKKVFVLVMIIVLVTLACGSETNSYQAPAYQAPAQPAQKTYSGNLITPKGAGVWLVGSEIAPGNWRSNGDCYAVPYSSNGEQIMGMTDGKNAIMYVSPSAFKVEFVDYPGVCTWSYIG